jgi:hypothetical protein
LEKNFISPFSLFCKSYLGDLRRVQLLWNSIQKHNKDKISFYVSVPQNHLNEFQEKITNSEGIVWISDEEIIRSNSLSDLKTYYAWDGRLSQQVIKSEFWRIFNKDQISYLCLDSESIFIKDFYLNDFLSTEGHPYTIIHQNKELLQLAANKRINKVLANFNHVCEMLKSIFNRIGPNYDFGPTPVIWSSEVWRALEENYLKPNKITIWDAIKEQPSELQWYGEALLKFKPIPLLPLEPLFRVYHYDWQYQFSKRNDETSTSLSDNYLGYLRQSNWDYDSDYGDHASRKSFSSRILRKIKRFFSRFR